MALSAAEKDRLFTYLLRRASAFGPLVVIRALYDALFLGDVARKNWLLAQIAAVKADTQASRNAVDAGATTTKAGLDAEIADLTTLETNL